MKNSTFTCSSSKSYLVIMIFFEYQRASNQQFQPKRFTIVLKPVNLCLEIMYKLNSKHIKTWTKKTHPHSLETNSLEPKWSWPKNTCKKNLNCDHEWQQQFFKLWKFAFNILFSTHLFGISPPTVHNKNWYRWLKTKKKHNKELTSYLGSEKYVRTYFIKFIVKFTQNL